MTDVIFAPSVHTELVEALNRTLIITFTPAFVTLPSTAPRGTIVGTFNAHWSTGGSYSGPFAFGGTHGSYGGIFAIEGEKVIVSQTGPGIGSLAGTTVDVKIIR